MNPNDEILEQILRLDLEAGAASHEWRKAQKELEELAKKSKSSEELILKTRTDMAFTEGDLRRQFKRIDEMDERKSDRAAKLFSAKTDDEHRSLKREVDNLDRDLRDSNRRIEDVEARIESLKQILFRTEGDLQSSLNATESEREKAQQAEKASSVKLDELSGVRVQHIAKLDDRVSQHYQRVAKITRNPNGPITRVNVKSCGNCHLSLAPQLLNNLLRAKDIENCPSCNHILLPHQNA